MSEQELIRKYVLQLLKTGDMTFGEFMQSFNQEKVSTHDLSEVLQGVTDEGQIIQEVYGKKLIYHQTSSLEERIRARTQLKIRDLLDKLNRSEWAEVDSPPPFTADLDANSMSVYLAHCVFQRRKSWREEVYDPWRLLQGRLTRKDKEVSLTFLLTNNDIDHFELGGIFRRHKGESMAIPKPAQEPYVETVFLKMLYIARTTQIQNSFSTNITTLAKGRTEVANKLLSYVEGLDIRPVPPAYRAVVSPMLRYFEADRQRKRIGRESYMKRHHEEHLPYMRHRVSDLMSRGIPNQISPS
ncbi:MAG: hypothetical protein J4452_03345 [Candidatus Aenigmarchaeota archaeon]|nr:hypothetical protein [Candidatus Aenigmarchaeota archaeon]